MLRPNAGSPAPDLGPSYEHDQLEAQDLVSREEAIEFDAAKARAGRGMARALVAVVVGCVLLGVLWKFGVLSRGFDKSHVSFHSIATSSRRGIKFGSSTIYALAGQKLTVQYNAQVNTGYFRIWIRQPQFPTLGPVEATTGNLKSGSGTLDFTIPRHGFYKIMIDGVPDGRGYDVSYDVSWSVQQ